MGIENIEQQTAAPKEPVVEKKARAFAQPIVEEPPVEEKYDAPEAATEGAVAEKKQEGEELGKEAEKTAEEKKAEEEARAAELGSEIERGQESMEGQIKSVERSRARWHDAMEQLEGVAKGAGKRYEGLASAEGMIASRKTQGERRLESMAENLQGQKVALAYKAMEDPEAALEQQQRLIEETSKEVEELAYATFALDKGKGDLLADFSGTFEMQFVQFGNIWEGGKEMEDTGNAEAIMKRLHNFLDEESPANGSAGAVSAAINAYTEKLSSLRLPNEVAQRRMEKEIEETREAESKSKKEGEKIEEITFIGGKKKEEGKEKSSKGNVRKTRKAA